MNKCKSIRYALVKVWIPFLVPILIFLYSLFLSNKFLLNTILQLLFGAEKKDLILLLSAYLNTSISFLLGIILGMQIISFFRKQNGSQCFNANGNVYYNHSYATFWVASKILGYGKIQLAGIPIGMQFKLVLRGTFPVTVEDVWENHYQNLTEVVLEDKKEFIEVDKINMEYMGRSNKINLLICDTYPIKMQDLDDKYQNNPTIIVKSTINNSQLRYLNQALVNAVRSNIQQLPRENIKDLYIFSTANPKNNLNIITSCFRFFDRFSINNVYVVQYGEDKKYKDPIKVI